MQTLQFLCVNDNLVPRVSHLPAPWSERGRDPGLVWSCVNRAKKFLRDESFVCSIFAVIMGLTGLRDSHVRVLA